MSTETKGKITHALAAAGGITAGIVPITGALPEGTPKWCQITVTVLGLLTTLAASVAKMRGRG